MSDLPDTRPLEQRVLAHVQATDHVSFAELCNHFGPAFTDGDRELLLAEEHPNVVLWAGLTEEASAAIRHLLATEAVHIQPASPLVYLYDGHGLRLPIAKRAASYKRPHWLPVTLRRGPAPTAGRAWQRQRGAR